MPSQNTQKETVTVISVGPAHVATSCGPITWDMLDASSNQDDQELAAVYQRLRSEAHTLVARAVHDGDVEADVEVYSDTGGATWTCRTVAYGRDLGRLGFRADEGMSHGLMRLAESEATAITERRGGRVKIIRP